MKVIKAIFTGLVNAYYRFGLYAICLAMAALFIVFSQACNKIQPPESIPAYVRLQSDSVKVTQGQGTASSKVTYAWIDANNDNRGLYQIPVSVPVLMQGKTAITVKAAVEEDGIAVNILPYPFYNSYTQTLNLVPGKLDTIKPVFTYSSNTHFEWPTGDFESLNTKVLDLQSDNTANAFQTSVKDSVFEGLYSYEVDLSPKKDTFHAYSHILFSGLPEPNYVVWLEMNYKTDVGLDVGVVPILTNGGQTTEEFISGVNPSSTWKKVYINLGPTLQFFTGQYTDFFIYFKAIAPGAKGHIFIDNLKLLYYE